MTRRFVTFLLIGLWPLAAGAAPTETCPGELDSILERYVEARGGAALDRQHALRVRSRHHEGRWNPHFDYRVMKPGYMRMTAIYDDGEVVVEGFDGEVVGTDYAELVTQRQYGLRVGITVGVVTRCGSLPEEEWRSFERPVLTGSVDSIDAVSVPQGPHRRTGAFL